MHVPGNKRTKASTFAAKLIEAGADEVHSMRSQFAVTVTAMFGRYSVHGAAKKDGKIRNVGISKYPVTRWGTRDAGRHPAPVDTRRKTKVEDLVAVVEHEKELDERDAS